MIDRDIRNAYPDWTRVTVRYGDTDRQGHVNNAVFSTFLESGRVNLLLDADAPLVGPGTALVIARLVLDFKAEINWPGEVEVATRVSRVGRSSFALEQAVFQNGVCAATAENVIVLMNEATRKSQPLSEAAATWLTARRGGAAAPAAK